MKQRVICLMLSLCILLSGCDLTTARNSETACFYYLCNKYQEDLCCVLVSEERDTSGHTGDLPYLLALYLMGPTNEEHRMPLPSGTQISVQNSSGHITLELSALPDAVSDVDFSLACACLTMTCLDMTNAEDVTIRSGNREKTMDRSSLTLYDSMSETTPKEDVP